MDRLIDNCSEGFALDSAGEDLQYVEGYEYKGEKTCVSVNVASSGNVVHKDISDTVSNELWMWLKGENRGRIKVRISTNVPSLEVFGVDIDTGWSLIRLPFNGDIVSIGLESDDYRGRIYWDTILDVDNQEDIDVIAAVKQMLKDESINAVVRDPDDDLIDENLPAVSIGFDEDIRQSESRVGDEIVRKGDGSDIWKAEWNGDILDVGIDLRLIDNNKRGLFELRKKVMDLFRRNGVIQVNGIWCQYELNSVAFELPMGRPKRYGIGMRYIISYPIISELVDTEVKVLENIGMTAQGGVNG